MGWTRPGPAEQEKGAQSPTSQREKSVGCFLAFEKQADFKEAGVSGPQMKEQLVKKATVKATFIFRTVTVRGSFTQHALF